MLVIRLFRVGRKNQPSFKIVVTDKRRAAHAGRFTEEVGFYNPVTKEKVLKPDRIKYWLSVGAKPSNTVFNLFVSEKIIEGKKIPAHKKSKKPIDAVQAKPAAAAAAAAPAAVPDSPVAPAPVAETPKEPVPEKPAEGKPVEPAPAEVLAKEEGKPASAPEGASAGKPAEPPAGEKPIEIKPEAPAGQK